MKTVCGLFPLFLMLLASFSVVLGARGDDIVQDKPDGRIEKVDLDGPFRPSGLLLIKVTPKAEKNNFDQEGKISDRHGSDSETRVYEQELIKNIYFVSKGIKYKPVVLACVQTEITTTLKGIVPSSNPVFALMVEQLIVVDSKDEKKSGLIVPVDEGVVLDKSEKGVDVKSIARLLSISERFMGRLRVSPLSEEEILFLSAFLRDRGGDELNTKIVMSLEEVVARYVLDKDSILRKVASVKLPDSKRGSLDDVIREFDKSSAYIQKTGVLVLDKSLMMAMLLALNHNNTECLDLLSKLEAQLTSPRIALTAVHLKKELLGNLKEEKVGK